MELVYTILCKWCWKMVGSFYCSRKYLTSSAMLFYLYKSWIRPKIGYCCHILEGAAKSSHSSLDHHQAENSSDSFHPTISVRHCHWHIFQIASRVIYKLVNVGVIRSSNWYFAVQWRFHRRVSHTSFVLLQVWPASRGLLSLSETEIGARCPYRHFFVGCFFQLMSNATHNILVYVPSSDTSWCFISVHIVEL